MVMTTLPRACPGKITRHRLSRGGDRGADNALHDIAVVRMSSHSPIRAYVARQRAAGRPNIHPDPRGSTLRHLAHSPGPPRERNQTRRHTLTNAYRDWLHAT